MKYFNDYYEASKIEGKKTRYDVTISSGSYPLFERLLKNRNGGQTLYLVDRPIHWGGSLERKTDKAITKDEQNISSLIIPDPLIRVAYGDIKSTNDAIIVILHDDWELVEIFISRGQKNNKLNLYQMVCDGELNDEMAELRDFSEDETANRKDTKIVTDIEV